MKTCSTFGSRNGPGWLERLALGAWKALSGGKVQVLPSPSLLPLLWVSLFLFPSRLTGPGPVPPTSVANPENEADRGTQQNNAANASLCVTKKSQLPHYIKLHMINYMFFKDKSLDSLKSLPVLTCKFRMKGENSENHEPAVQSEDLIGIAQVDAVTLTYNVKDLKEDM